ncbi:Y-family DNA polymerase [Desulfovibrio sp. JY]|nr:Y-family DNA polymerase [Desulfovibrio sp. JY]
MPPRQILALVDCNSFYASCEKVFVPSLANRPVVVLSNNDGCVIARSAEAKAAGIPMGKPAFECRELFRRHNAAVFSSNYTLYGDMSARVMKTLARFTPNLEIYSIDEAFLELTGMPYDVMAYSRQIRATVGRWTGIPVSIGLGPTKTLAKVANKLAKKDAALEGVLDFEACADPDAVLERVPVEDVWGIGRRYTAMLERLGVRNARQFRDLPRDLVKKRMTIGGLHTQLELRGIPCLDLETVAPAKKSVAASRSFSRPVLAIEDMREAVATYVTRAAERMRAARLQANGVTVWVQTNTFIEGEPQYANSAYAALPVATAHTAAIIRAAIRVLERIFRKGYRYKKAGIMLSGLERLKNRQLSLLEPEPEAGGRGERLMRVLDAINDRFGRDALKFAACGIEQDWRMKQALRSPHYTTNWRDILEVKAI